jgi:hypothetical protein
MKQTIVFSSVLIAYATGGAEPASEVDNDWFRGWAPAEVTYSFPSNIRERGRRLGDFDTLAFHIGYIADVRQGDTFEWLLGIDWRRIQTSVPDGVAVPNTLQSAAAVLGFDSRIWGISDCALKPFPVFTAISATSARVI